MTGEVDVAHQILIERRRQIGEKGYDPIHDDHHKYGELLMGALSYMCSPGDQLWPWDPASFHQSSDPVRNLVKAGALVAAEGDRLMRRRLAGLPVVGGLIILGLDPNEMERNVEGLRRVNSEMKSLAQDSDS